MSDTSSNRTKAVWIGSIGGGLELYDFSIYIFFAPILGKLFFPANNSFVTLLQTFSVFAIGYFARPIGAISFGHFGDKLGRKKGMILSIFIMAFSTMGIGLLPSYESIGITATFLLIIFRFLQGFAVGGDLPGAITFVAEYADSKHRALFCSLVYFAVNLGLLMASFVGFFLTFIFSSSYLISFGWRIAFLLGAIIGIVGFYLRSKVLETPYFDLLEKNRDIVKMPIVHLFKIHSNELFLGIGLVWLFAVVISQLFLYMPSYLNTVKHISLNNALIINSANIILFSLCIPLVGYLSDKIGRKPIIFLAALLFSLLTYPLYRLIFSPNFILNTIAFVVFSILAAGVAGTIPVILAEMFPTHVRYSGVGIAYNIGFALFAGLTPIIATYLLYQLHFKEAPSLNLIVSAVIALIVCFKIKETSGKTLKPPTQIYDSLRKPRVIPN